VPEPPTYQRIFKYVCYTLAGVIGLGTLLDSLSNAITLIVPYVTYLGTPLLIFFWLLAEYVLRKFPLRWVAKGGRGVRLQRLGALPRCAILGAVLLLWVPRTVDKDQKSYTDQAANPVLSLPQSTPQISEPQLTRDTFRSEAPSVDDSQKFVRQHYYDFYNREPDTPSIQFWISEIERCGADAQCRAAKRVNISAAFFLSIEFQETGYLVYRVYKVAYGNTTSPGVPGTVPVVRFQELLPDTQRIGQGVMVGQGMWEQRLKANKTAYMAEFVQRPRFLAAFPLSMTPAQFVDRLNQNAGSVLTRSERDQLVAQLKSSADVTAERASVLRSVAENKALQSNEFNRAFVLMLYYGYLRRNPDDPPDPDFHGWRVWLDRLNQFKGDFTKAGMVNAFINSTEYRLRLAH